MCFFVCMYILFKTLFGFYISTVALLLPNDKAIRTTVDMTRSCNMPVDTMRWIVQGWPTLAIAIYCPSATEYTVAGCCFISVTHEHHETYDAWIRNHRPSVINNYIHYDVWDEISFSFPNFNDCNVVVWELINIFISYIQMVVWIYHLSMQRLKLNHVSRRDPRKQFLGVHVSCNIMLWFIGSWLCYITSIELT